MSGADGTGITPETPRRRISDGAGAIPLPYSTDGFGRRAADGVGNPEERAVEGIRPTEGAPATPALTTGKGPRPINVALQGGGTHGAFTWGVLDRLLREESIEIHAISGTSAGAINGAMVVQGIARDGREGALKELDKFWRAVAAKLQFSALRNTPFERLIFGPDLSHSLAWQAFDTFTRVLSPYQFNPFPIEVNPLRRTLEEVLDETTICGSARAPRLFVSATNVRTGKPRVFARHEVTLDALLASACLPQLFRAVEINGEAYWDGGYLGNPALWPLYDRGGPPDIVVVQLNPMIRDDIPRTVSDIGTRMNEVTFNASLMFEMRAIEFVQRLVDQGVLSPPRYQRLFVHLIEDEDRMRQFGMSSKYNGDWDFLCTLRDIGRDAADAWLRDHRDDLGKRDSIDVRARFL
ncbi:patatin-like phospholipase family protein [Roseomonas sp. CCTCC AB2023176]|uniref:patatin-like phospholipase family protein n=1 Tax=Roseomonas sp. CCTCC AB2023176 TaxID=3342640 RepID=UPI0035E2CC4E